MTAKEYKKFNKKYNEELNDILCIGIGRPHFSNDYPVEFLQMKRQEWDELGFQYMNFLKK